jgi:MraZ protein
VGHSIAHEATGGSNSRGWKMNSEWIRVRCELAGPMVITDRYDHAIDEKNRLAIPSEIRRAMDPEVDGVAFYLLPEGRYLQLIPEKLFQKLTQRIDSQLALSGDVARARRLVFASASRLEPDKQGRVIIPDRFMADAKSRDPFTDAVLSREVTLVGVGDRAELWNRADFYAHMRELLADRNTVMQSPEKAFGSAAPAGESPAARA